LDDAYVNIVQLNGLGNASARVFPIQFLTVNNVARVNVDWLIENSMSALKKFVLDKANQKTAFKSKMLDMLPYVGGEDVMVRCERISKSGSVQNDVMVFPTC
jgi:hypothetical protein